MGVHFTNPERSLVSLVVEYEHDEHRQQVVFGEHVNARLNQTPDGVLYSDIE